MSTSKMMGTVPVAPDVHAENAPTTNGITALAADGAAESHSDSARGVVSTSRSRRGDVAAETEGVSP